MKERKYENGQIVWYIGPDLAAYEPGKTYTVLDYDEEIGSYEILSYMDDETFFLAEDMLKPLSEEEEKEIKISDRMLEYYQYEEDPASIECFDAVDEKRLTEIIEMARDDVRNSRLKREREEFASDSEYRIYLSDLAGEAYSVKYDIKTLSMPLSEQCLYIYEFYPENVIVTDDGEKYDWDMEGKIYDGSWPISDYDLGKHLGKATYDGYKGYPASCCWLLDRESLLKLADAFPDIIYSLDRTKLDKEQYVVIWCYWD